MSYEDIKHMCVADLLAMLQQLSKDNINTMKANTEKLNNAISAISDEKKRNNIINPILQSNHALNNENILLLQMHNSLVSILKQILQVNVKIEFADKGNANNTDTSPNRTVESGVEEYFELTVNEEVAFDESHPYYKDEIFKGRLLQYYIKNEEYEKCAALIV